ncbi:MAG TPA: hypothetical protein DCY88_22655, partial [Cyanobacteria bacterium UBA11372]|nr:hypothetical protein [Cyanobacteria bacterium UBA11372]
MHEVKAPTLKHFNGAPRSVVEEGMVLQLADGTIAAWNAAAVELLGLTTEQIKGWSSTHCPWQAIHEDGTDFPDQTHPAKLALLTGQPQFNVVMGLDRKDKEPIWLEIDAQPLFQVGSSTTYGAISTFRQISASQIGQKRTHQQPDGDLAQSADVNCSDLSCCKQSASTSKEAIALFNLSIDLLETASLMMHEIAQREQAEESLRESQAQLQQQLAEIEAIYQSAPVGLNVLDTELRFVRINQRLAEINGFPVEAHIGRTIREVLPGIADIAEQLLRPILQTGEPLLNVEIQGETPAQPGVQRTWIEHFLPLKDGDRTIGISTVCEEITERKQAQAKIQDQKERLEAALFAAETGTFRWDIRTNALDWDENLDRLFGLPPGETARSLDAFIEMVHPEDRQGVIDRCQRCATSGADFDMDFRVVYPDGSIRWLSDKGKTFFDGEGNPAYITGACVDISDRKQAEEKLRESEEHLRYTVELNPQVPWTADPDGRITGFSDRWLELTGLTRQQALGEGWMQVPHPDDSPAMVAAWTHSLRTGEPYDIEHRIKLADGSYRWMRSCALPRRNEQGEIVGWYGTTEDIDDRKQAEAALRQTEEFKDRILESSPDCIKLLDLDGRLLYMNSGGLCVMEIDDFTPFHNADWVCFWQGEDRKQAEQALAAAKAGEVSIFRGYCPTAKGTPKWWEAIVSPIRDASGGVAQILSISRDITERKQAEEALRRSEERYRVLFESMEDGFCVIEMLFDQKNQPIDYRFMEMNPAFELQTGLKQAEGKTARQLLPNLENYW